MEGRSLSGADRLPGRLRTVARILLILVGGLLPLIFWPSLYVPSSGGKTMIVAAAVALSIFFLILSILREGKLALRLPLPILGLWLVAIVAGVSAIFSNDVRDAFFGVMLDGYSVGFLILMAGLATAAFTFVESKQAVIRLYSVMIFSAVVLTIFHVARLFFGPEALSLGFFSGATASPVGSWNGLAIFYSLIVLISLIALQQLPLSRAGRVVAIVVVALCLMMLAVINFSASWWVLAIVSGVITLHQLAFNMWKSEEHRSETKDSFDLVMVSIGILVVSIIFLVGGARLSAAISDRLGVGFVEVRPSAEATLNLAQASFQDNFLLGSGPNRFTDVWRLHKDPSINQTIFWNAPFDSGYSYLFTSIINTGLLGLVAWLVFFASIVWAGIRFLFSAAVSEKLDRFWYFIGLSSLAATVYFFIMAAIYVPPPTILLLSAITTGVFVAAYTKALPSRAWHLSAVNHRLHGVVLILLSVATVSAMGYGLYQASLQTLSVYQFNKTLATVAEGDTLESINGRIIDAYNIANNDMYVRQVAANEWSQMRSVLAVAEPTDADRATFQASAARGIEAAQLAVDLDSTEPLNHQILGQIYAILAVVEVEGAADRAREAFAAAKSYDPQNPLLPLLEADLAMQRQDGAAARSAAEEAVRLRPNYTEALYFLAQLDINEGNVDSAINIVNGMVQLEPQNPARRYQLGVLLVGANRLDEAALAFEQTVALDPQYANAHFYRGLVYAEQGRVEDAIAALTLVRNLSESNAGVDTLIDQLRQNGRLDTSLNASSTVSDRDPARGEVTEEDLENDLVTSSNPVPAAENAEDTAE